MKYHRLISIPSIVTMCSIITIFLLIAHSATLKDEHLCTLSIQSIEKFKLSWRQGKTTATAECPSEESISASSPLEIWIPHSRAKDVFSEIGLEISRNTQIFNSHQKLIIHIESKDF